MLNDQNTRKLTDLINKSKTIYNGNIISKEGSYIYVDIGFKKVKVLANGNSKGSVVIVRENSNYAALPVPEVGSKTIANTILNLRKTKINKRKKIKQVIDESPFMEVLFIPDKDLFTSYDNDNSTTFLETINLTNKEIYSLYLYKSENLLDSEFIIIYKNQNEVTLTEFEIIDYLDLNSINTNSNSVFSFETLRINKVSNNNLITILENKLIKDNSFTLSYFIQYNNINGYEFQDYLNFNSVLDSLQPRIIKQTFLFFNASLSAGCTDSLEFVKYNSNVKDIPLNTWDYTTKIITNLSSLDTQKTSRKNNYTLQSEYYTTYFSSGSLSTTFVSTDANGESLKRIQFYFGGLSQAPVTRPLSVAYNFFNTNQSYNSRISEVYKEEIYVSFDNDTKKADYTITTDIDRKITSNYKSRSLYGANKGDVSYSYPEHEAVVHSGTDNETVFNFESAVTLQNRENVFESYGSVALASIGTFKLNETIKIKGNLDLICFFWEHQFTRKIIESSETISNKERKSDGDYFIYLAYGIQDYGETLSLENQTSRLIETTNTVKSKEYTDFNVIALFEKSLIIETLTIFLNETYDYSKIDSTPSQENISYSYTKSKQLFIIDNYKNKQELSYISFKTIFGGKLNELTTITLNSSDFFIAYKEVKNESYNSSKINDSEEIFNNKVKEEYSLDGTVFLNIYTTDSVYSAKGVIAEIDNTIKLSISAIKKLDFIYKHKNANESVIVIESRNRACFLAENQDYIRVVNQKDTYYLDYSSLDAYDTKETILECYVGVHKLINDDLVLMDTIQDYFYPNSNNYTYNLGNYFKSLSYYPLKELEKVTNKNI